MSEELWSDILIYHEGKQYSTKFKSKKVENGRMVITMELIPETGLKCIGKLPTFFNMTCGEPVITDKDGRLRHKFAHIKTYDHEPEIGEEVKGE